MGEKGAKGKVFGETLSLLGEIGGYFGQNHPRYGATGNMRHSSVQVRPTPSTEINLQCHRSVRNQFGLVGSLLFFH